MPLMVHVGEAPPQFPLASHVRMVSPVRVYPELQLNVAFSRYVVDTLFEKVTSPFVGVASIPQFALKARSMKSKKKIIRDISESFRT